jgi:hypothetical protein
MIAVKGKGEIEAWYLIGPPGDRASAANHEAHEPTLADRADARTSRNAGPQSTRA